MNRCLQGQLGIQTTASEPFDAIVLFPLPLYRNTGQRSSMFNLRTCIRSSTAMDSASMSWLADFGIHAESQGWRFSIN